MGDQQILGILNSDPESDTSRQDPVILSVSDLNAEIKEQIEGRYTLVWVRGEISNFKAHSSGHFYFTLKDQDSQILAVMFRGFNSRLKFRPEDGAEVVVRGRVSVYEPRGNYQIICEMMEPVGFGALQMAFEQLKKKLQAEGLLDASRKRPLPALPARIALITSPTGAAVRDMVNVLTRRFRGLDITVIPCAVQGVQAPKEIIRAIQQANQVGFDVMIVGRGGGSMEDLWAFNDEAVARAIVASKIPVVSAVGHEVDFTIADFVADLRAPTPSAAAELIVKNAADIQDRILNYKRQITQSMRSQLEVKKNQWQRAQKGLIDPKKKLQDMMLRCDEWQQRIEQAIKRKIENLRMQVDRRSAQMMRPEQLFVKARGRVDMQQMRLQAAQKNILSKNAQKFQRLSGALDSMSPLRVVERGYSMVLKDEELIKSTVQVKINDELRVRLAHGELNVKVLKIKE